MNLLPADLDARTALALAERSLNYRELGERVQRFHPEDDLRLATRHGANLQFMVPTIFQILAEAPGPETIAAPFRARHRFPPRFRHDRGRRPLLRVRPVRACDSVGRPMPQLRTRICRDDGERTWPLVLD